MKTEYLVLVGDGESRDTVLKFSSTVDLRAWMAAREEPGMSPLKFNAQFLGTVFRPSELTPEFIDSLEGFESLFNELDAASAKLKEAREGKRRAAVRRAKYNNRPNRR